MVEYLYHGWVWVENHVFVYILRTNSTLNVALFIVHIGTGTAYFDKGIGPFFMHNVTCVGFESTLLECKHIIRVLQVHGRAAGVRCLRGKYFKHEVLYTATVTPYGSAHCCMFSYIRNFSSYTLCQFWLFKFTVQISSTHTISLHFSVQNII